MDSGMSSVIVYLIPLVLVVLAIGFVMGRRSRDGRDLSGPPGIQMPEPHRHMTRESGSSMQAKELNPETRMLIEAALNANQKIEAIKLLREATGMGLKEAKEAIEDGHF